jgi:endonuclease YncB( thermonuclease family)
VLLEQGLAIVYRRFSFRMKEDFLTAETEAMKDKQGLWK